MDIIHADRDRRRFPPGEDPRGRSRLIATKDIHEMERILEELDVYGRTITWDALGYEAGLDVSGRTVRRAMGTMEYHCYLAKRRVDWAAFMKGRYPTAYHWRRVRFSDESHAGLGSQGKLYIIRREIEERDKKRVHSDLISYTTPTNTIGKMSQRVYIDSVLNPIIKPWIQNGDNFVLEEDQDSGHAPARTKENIVKLWKEKNGLEHYFNCAGSPDLAIIEDCFQPMKQHLKKFTHWEPDETQQLLKEGWDGIKQDWIMRLQAVIDAEGQIIPNMKTA
ncbi:hypothetical protein P152DRAFT_506644 [Eremomyces bilateralis CBS 781.70]|uniref:Tc1-like transposase DDE domain-containing protein n=1 Tax=Eremomyces bilateralis CBS 781.70 TaxID=1392243 RepID=A0A6G1G700_9PEZI|nr:uncharacterized protein P152DRAFT_506644 [Eremomyces bilateralis CBS 781.70]KAF1813823.1 hypothetical protein P152DRAFT_506644 [Eremomyces bilateralis CBS 781.70]